MIELVITAKTNQVTDKTRWFVEWPKAGTVNPNRLCRLLEIVYQDMKYVGAVGLCVSLVGLDPYGQPGPFIRTEPTHEVLWMDEGLEFRNLEYVRRLSEHLQSQYEIVGVVFHSQPFAELFKLKIEALWTFKALQKDYS